jgi:hypothetical protein
MTCEHVPALHVSSGGCPSDGLDFGNPSPLQWESTRVMGGEEGIFLMEVLFGQVEGSDDFCDKSPICF